MNLVMKRFLVVTSLILGLAVVASAQPKALGARMGYFGLQASYEHYLGDPNFLEIDLGVNPFQSTLGFNVAGSYNWTFAQPNWTYRGNWAWYAGPGANFGTTYVSSSEPDTAGSQKFFFGMFAQVGLEYTFWFPLQLSADIRPSLSICDGKFWNGSLFAGLLMPTISARYSF